MESRMAFYRIVCHSGVLHRLLEEVYVGGKSENVGATRNLCILMETMTPISLCTNEI